MGTENDDDQENDSNKDEDLGTDKSKESGETFTQDQVTRIAAREKDQGKRSGHREILDILGLDNVDDVKAFMQKQQEREQAQMSEADKAKAAAARAQQEAETMRAQAALERYNARVERALLQAGVSEELISKASRLVDVDDPSDADQEVITAAVADLRKEMPQLFQPDGKSGRQSQSDPGKAPPKKVDNDPTKRARSRLEQRHGSKLKQST